MSSMIYKHIFGFTRTIMPFILVARNTLDTGEGSQSSNPQPCTMSPRCGG